MKVGIALHQNFMQAFDKLKFINRSVVKMIEWKRCKLSLFEEIKMCQEVKEELIKEYSEKDEKGEMIFVSGNAQQGGQPCFVKSLIPEFEQKMNDLFSQDLKTILVTIPISKIPDTLELSELEFELLEAFIDLEEVKTVIPEVLPAV